MRRSGPNSSGEGIFTILSTARSKATSRTKARGRSWGRGQDGGKKAKQISASPYVIQLICLTLSKPSPMTPMLQKLPVSVYSIFTFEEVNPYAQAPERGGDEELLQVTAKVEVALFVVAAAGL